MNFICIDFDKSSNVVLDCVMRGNYSSSRNAADEIATRLCDRGFRILEYDFFEDGNVSDIHLIKSSTISDEQSSVQKRVLSMRRVDAAFFDRILDKWKYGEFVAINHVDRSCEPLEDYLNAKLHMASLAMDTKEFMNDLRITGDNKKNLDKSFRDLMYSHNGEKPMFSLIIDEQKFTYYKPIYHV